MECTKCTLIFYVIIHNIHYIHTKYNEKVFKGMLSIEFHNMYFYHYEVLIFEIKILIYNWLGPIIYLPEPPYQSVDMYIQIFREEILYIFRCESLNIQVTCFYMALLNNVSISLVIRPHPPSPLGATHYPPPAGKSLSYGLLQGDTFHRAWQREDQCYMFRLWPTNLNPFSSLGLSEAVQRGLYCTNLHKISGGVTHLSWGRKVLIVTKDSSPYNLLTGWNKSLQR